MSHAITKKWLRHQHKLSKSVEPFKAWCKTSGKHLVEAVIEAGVLYVDGPNHKVAKLTGLQMGDGAALAYMTMKENQSKHKEFSHMLHAAKKTAKAKKKGSKQK